MIYNYFSKGELYSIIFPVNHPGHGSYHCTGFNGHLPNSLAEVTSQKPLEWTHKNFTCSVKLNVKMSRYFFFFANFYIELRRGHNKFDIALIQNEKKIHFSSLRNSQYSHETFFWNVIKRYFAFFFFQCKKILILFSQKN